MFPKKIYYIGLIFASLLLVQCHNHPIGESSIQQTAEMTKSAKAIPVNVSPIEVAKKEAEKVGAATKNTLAIAKEEMQEKGETVKNNVTKASEKVVEETKEAAKKMTDKAKAVTKKVSEEVKETAKKVTPKKKKPIVKKRSKIQFEKTVHQFGTIKQGDVVKYDFKFTNTGNAPLAIKKVDVSCGCTFPSYPFIPIPPGEEGVIGVNFNSTGKVGFQKPTITVVTNGSPRTLKLNLEGIVE